MAAPELVTSEAIGVPGGVASADVSVLTTQAEPGLANATNLGDLSSGLLKIIVTLGVATILNANIADTAHACVLTTTDPTALTLPTTGTLAVLSDIPAPYALPIATAGSLGGIRVGSGLSIDGDGILSATGGGSGTVTSVGLALPSSEFDTTGGTNPVTGSGTLTGTWKTQTANYGFMGPASGAAAAPAFRALVAADIPGSTVGKAVLALTNPDAVSFPRFNADNTVNALSAANFRTAIGAGTSSFDGAYASLSGKPTLGTASAQDVGYFATAAQAFPGFGTTHALAAYGDHAHSGIYAPVAQTMYIGTTAVAINRGWGSLTLADLTFTAPLADTWRSNLFSPGKHVQSVVLNNTGTTEGSGTAIYMGYHAVEGVGCYGARILQLGYPSSTRSSDLYLQVHGYPADNEDTSWITGLSITRAGLVNVPSLTASRVILTDASKNLVSRTVSGDASGAVALETDVASGTWTPAFTNLTVVNGTGGATYTGGYVRIGNIVNWWAKIATSGTCTTASTFATTILNNLPFSSVSPSVCHATRSSSGTNIFESGWTQAGGNNAYMPSWAAYDGDIYISGVIFLV